MIKQKVSILKYHPNKMLLLLVLVGLSLLSALISNYTSQHAATANVKPEFNS